MRYCVLVAKPRSGTTALRDVLSKSSAVQSIGEIFTDRTDVEPTPYIYWCDKVFLEAPELTRPFENNRAELFMKYLNFSENYYGNPTQPSCTLVTINYNSLHMMNAVWQNMFDTPFVLEIVRRNRVGAIHLVRRNILRALVSDAKARQTNVWHRTIGNRLTSQDSQSDQLPKITIDTSTLVKELSRRSMEIDFVSRFFATYKNALTVYYEELFEDSGMPVPGEFEKIFKFMDVQCTRPVSTEYIKTGKSELENDIENWSEVCARLSETEFEKYLN